jgi:hypothetical protein
MAGPGERLETAARISHKFDQLAAEGKLHGFMLWPVADGWQASMQTGKNAGWRIRRGATPSEAIEAVLSMDYVDEIDERNGIASESFTPAEPVDFGDAAVDQIEADEPPEASVFD